MNLQTAAQSSLKEEETENHFEAWESLVEFSAFKAVAQMQSDSLKA